MDHKSVYRSCPTARCRPDETCFIEDATAVRDVNGHLDDDPNLRIALESYNGGYIRSDFEALFVEILVKNDSSKLQSYTAATVVYRITQGPPGCVECFGTAFRRLYATHWNQFTRHTAHVFTLNCGTSGLFAVYQHRGPGARFRLSDTDVRYGIVVSRIVSRMIEELPIGVPATSASVGHISEPNTGKA